MHAYKLPCIRPIEAVIAPYDERKAAYAASAARETSKLVQSLRKEIMQRKGK